MFWKAPGIEPILALNMRFNTYIYIYIYIYIAATYSNKTQSSLELNSDSRVGIGMVHRAWFCLDASILSFFYRRTEPCSISIIKLAMYEGIK